MQTASCIFLHLKTFMQLCLGNETWVESRRNKCISDLRETLKCERMEEALGVLGERKCSENSFWNLHQCHHTWTIPSCAVCSLLRLCLSEEAPGRVSIIWVSVQVLLCHRERATGIAPILKAIWMAQMDFLPGEVWERSAAGYLFCLQAILISCMEVYFIIFSWTVE